MKSFSRHRLDGYRLVNIGPSQVRSLDLRVISLLCVLVLLVMLSSMFVGATPVSWMDVIHLFNLEHDDSKVYALFELRLPRAINGFLAGAGVAIAGAMLQSMTRNPIAEPGLLGLSQGVLTGIILTSVLSPTIAVAWLPLVGLLGGISVALLLAWLTRHSESGNALAILLLGLAIETLLSSISAILILYSPTDISYALSAWLAGSLYLADWSAFKALLPWWLLGIVLLICVAPMLSLLELGHDRAVSLGLHSTSARLLILLTAVLLTSSSVAISGPLVFLGVVAPHLSHFILPNTAGARLLTCGLVGGLLVLLADICARSFGQDLSLPIGLCLTLIGVPLFIFTLRLNRLHARE